MAENWSGIFDRRADVEIFRFRIVGWDEVKAGRIFVVNAGWIHETARARRLECFGQVSNFKFAKTIRQTNELMILEKFDHLRLPTLIRFQERGLNRRNVLTAGGVWISQRWIG